jgi:hypothetical protein
MSLTIRLIIIAAIIILVANIAIFFLIQRHGNQWIIIAYISLIEILVIGIHIWWWIRKSNL